MPRLVNLPRMSFRRVVPLLLVAGCLWLSGCEKQSNTLEHRRLALLKEENARLVEAISKLDPSTTIPPAIVCGNDTNPAVNLEGANEQLREIYRKHERASALATNLEKRTEIEKAVEEIRGMKFKRPVDYSVLGRKDIKGALMKRMNAVFSDDEFAEQANVLFRLGLVPENFALKEKYINLLGEQVAAFFDQHEHRLYMYDDATLENGMNRMILAHELMHAMQDQHHSLKSLPLEEKRNDDQALAAAALIEGEATLLMAEYMSRGASPSLLLENMGAMFMQNMDQLAAAPRVLRESLLFPYQDGLAFCTAGYSRKGWDAMTDAYRQPPRSTTQILHPEKYFGPQREDPIAVQWPDARFEGKMAQWDNVMGELGIRILFTDWHSSAVATKSAEGWRGDRYLSFESGSSLVWKTVWASQADAAEFFQAEKDLLARRYKAEAPVSVERRWESNRPRALRLVMNDRAEVLLIDAATSEKASALEEQFGK